MQEGEIDAFTMVFSHEIGKWSPGTFNTDENDESLFNLNTRYAVSEVPSLREAIARIAGEEEAAEEALRASSSNATQQNIYIFDPDDDSQPAYDLSDVNSRSSEAVSAAGLSSGAVKKSFVADDGKRYVWDDIENDWVEDDNDDEFEYEEDDTEFSAHDRANSQRGVEKSNSNTNTNASIAEERKREGEGRVDTDGSVEAAAEKKEKRKKKNKKKQSKTWVYVTGPHTMLTLANSMEHYSSHSLIHCAVSRSVIYQPISL